MLKWIAVLLLALPAFGQSQLGGYPTTTATSSGSPTLISNVLFSPSDTTIAATWYTSTQSDSHLTCGGKVAVDDGYETSATFHQVIVAGLTAATQYTCVVKSGSTSSSQSVTTLAAPTRTPVTSTMVAGTTITSLGGDTLYNAQSNDGKTYMTQDDGNGLSGSGANENMMLSVITNENKLAGSTVNLLSNYGTSTQLFGSAGPGGTALAHKASGMFAMAGSLFIFETQNNYAQPQIQWYGNIIQSKDHGVTWNNFLYPVSTSPNGIPMNPANSFEFGTSTWGWCNPVMYAPDDGTIGYTVAGNKIDGADAYVYGSCLDGNWDNGNNLYMWRIPRVQMLSQNPGAIQWWTGGTATVSSFVNDANWSFSNASATAIYSVAGQTSAQDEFYVPGMNYYVLLEWYHPSATVTSNTVTRQYAGPTPAGPWTLVGSQTNSPGGYYNFVALHPDVASNTLTSNVPIEIGFSGDYGAAGSATFYHPTYAMLTLNPPAEPTPTTFMSTTFNEGAGGAALNGTTPATCISPCTGTWSAGAGWNYVAGGGVNSTGTTYAIINAAGGTPNYTMTVTLTTTATSNNQIAVRYTGTNQFVAINLQPTYIQMYDVNPSGNLSTSGFSLASGLNTGTFVIKCFGRAITVLQGGNVVASLTLAANSGNLTSGKVGFGEYTAATNAVFNSMSVTNQF